MSLRTAIGPRLERELSSTNGLWRWSTNRSYHSYNSHE